MRSHYRRRRALAAALTALAVTALPPAALAAEGQTMLISRVGLDGPVQAPGPDAYGETSVSKDGRFVAFSSAANNLSSLDANGNDDVYVKDTETGEIELISRPSYAQAPPGTGHSLHPSISADGRYVAFTSTSQLAIGDLNQHPSVYVRDREKQRTRLISFEVVGAQDGNGASVEPSISDDGRYVAFTSYATDLSFDDGPAADVFVRDRDQDETYLVSRGEPGGQASNAAAGSPAISGDGRHVAFTAAATNFGISGVAHDQVWRRDLQTGQTLLVSGAKAGPFEPLKPADRHTFRPTISGDGGSVAFESTATNLSVVNVRGKDIYVRRLNGIQNFVKPMQLNRANGVSGAVGNEDAFEAEISRDGRYVAFASKADNLSPEANGAQHVWVRDTVAHTTKLVSRADGPNGAPPAPPALSFEPSMSPEGGHVAFLSGADDLSPEDADGTVDVFRRDVLAP